MMGIDEALMSAREALNLIVQITLPVLLLTGAIGLLVTVFQSVTQINESTIQQNLKIFVTLIALFVTAPAMLLALENYMAVMIDRINALAPP